ncbi:hypothetical protein EJ05DRAFT_472340 [Pseudovirgaria hyperparasitica]|uniref:Signal recognition particle subunit SRP72 n=1 Tax=Pseudovirgaria hyperparasitica TaxID=470096 RepID=A0A6A6WMQ4_9PEZI|nr:uncharacterized protein EJ05DRAFT_472340 [Pseudovirgaria hyperparasitica]KAF2763432.1 hypothetical protein EJ05DRAFT_472340 [Pseudovirgaria hyperparasitica]
MSLSSLAALLSKTKLDDPEDVLRAANEALKKNRTNPEALHVKAIALLKLDRFEDALNVFEDGGNKLQETAALGYSYALYKAMELEKAEEVASKAEQSRGISHVLAQTLYRAEKFDQSAKLYSQLSSQGPEQEEEENDLRINSGAVDAQLEWQGNGSLVKKKKPDRVDMEAFETAFNAACGSVARGELAQAEILLKRAEDLCNSLDDLTDEEKKAETLPINVQQLYVFSMQGKTDAAEKLSARLDINQIPDLSTRRIAQLSSLSSAKETSNPYLMHRLTHAAPSTPKSDEPFRFQSSILRQNTHVLDLLALKYSGVANSTSSYIAKNADASPTSTSPFSVINAAAHAQNQTGKAAIKVLVPLLEKRPNDAGLVLAIVHLYLLTNNHAAAVHLLEGFFKKLEQSESSKDLDVRYSPGLIATIVSLYAAQSRKSHGRIELAKAANHWRTNSKGSQPPASLLRAAGISLLDSNDEDDLNEAGAIFTAINAHDPSDQAAVAGLIAAYATSDPSKLTDSQIALLPPTARLIQNIDAAALEDAGVAVPPQPATTTSKKRAAPEKEKPTKPHKIRKTRMPKDYVEGKKVDPERWLPLKDRSYYRPKGRKGKKKDAGLTQGGVVAEDKPSAPEVQKSGGGGGGGGGAQNKKKKKGKGGKW